MLSYFNLRKGVQFKLDDQPYEVLDFHQMGKAQNVFVAQTKIKNLLNGKIIERNFHQSDTFEEIEIEKIPVKFVYSNRGKFIFSEIKNPGKRFELTQDQLGDSAKFLKSNTDMIGFSYENKIVNIELPIKVQLEVNETVPGVKGDRAQSGTKPATLETGAIVNVPLFIESGEIIEVNTETGQYVRRIS